MKTFRYINGEQTRIWPRNDLARSLPEPDKLIVQEWMPVGLMAAYTLVAWLYCLGGNGIPLTPVFRI